jgi:hypothetical protein
MDHPDGPAEAIATTPPAEAASPRAGSSFRKAAAIIGAAALLEVIAVGAFYWALRSWLERNMFGASYQGGPAEVHRYEYLSDGIRQPPARPAESARLADAEVVIGVEVGGVARAYRLAALEHRSRHIVNDVVAGVPVTVTYCDLDRCIRAFAGPKGGPPLDVSQGGLLGRKMVLRVGGIDYLQDSGAPVKPGEAPAAFPYSSFPASRTSWKAWREAHPNTDVYVGEAAGNAR